LTGTALSEFSPKRGSVGRGIAAAVADGVKFVVIPAAVLLIIPMVAGSEAVEMAERLGLNAVMSSVLMAGIPIAVLSFFRGFYPKGSIPRAIMGVGVAALTGLWLWLVTQGGLLTIDLGEAGATVDFSGFIYLLLAGAALKGLYYVAEMSSYRKEWLAPKEAAPAAVGGAGGGAAAP